MQLSITSATGRKQLAEYWNYIDVLSLVVAYSPLRKFPGTRARWHEAVAKLKERFEAQAPELFKDIHFERRYPLPPQSDEVAEFLRTLAWSGITEEPNPAYQVVQLKPHKKSEIKRRSGPRLKRYDRVIKQMSRVLTEEFKEGG